MTTAIEFEFGVFQKFRVTGTFLHLGAHSLNIPENAIIEFDGVVVKYGGKDYDAPAVRGALKLGWIVPVADKTSGYKAAPSELTMHASTPTTFDRGAASKVSQIDADEDVVGTLGASNAKREAAREAVRDGGHPTLPKEFPTGRPVNAARVEPVSAGIKKFSKTLLKAEDDEIEWSPDLGDEEEEAPEVGVVVGKILSPAVKTIKLTDDFSADAAMREVENSKPVRVTRKKASADVSIKTNLPNGATGDVAEIIEGDTLEELLPDAAGSRKVVALAVEGETLTWDKSGHPMDRAKKALEMYGDNAPALEALMAVEAKAVVKQIQQELNRRSR